MNLNAEDFFEPWQRVANGWDESLDEIGNVLMRATSSRPRQLVWRGVVDSSWALHSSLYRRLDKAGGPPPDEKDVVNFEKALLDQARKRWRFDNLSALEILAHLQHYGGPTRLLDVSYNPLVALWFAVEKKFASDGTPETDRDGRLFVFDATDRHIDLDDRWGGHALPWANAPTDWRRGLPRIWRPPSYNERIPAQNSAFLVGGIPQTQSGDNSKYRKAPGDGTNAPHWLVDEVRAATSVTLSMNVLSRNCQKQSTPTFTLKILAEKKPEIRGVLETHYGFNSASIYPDLFGLAQHGADGL